MRIVSLLPSATEIIYALGLGDYLVGVSHECDFPREAQSKPRVILPVFDSLKLDSEAIDEIVIEHLRHGESLYRIDLDAFKTANPDLVITQELCGVCAIGVEDVLMAVSKLPKPVEVLSLNPHSLNDIRDDVRRVGKAVGLPEKADWVIQDLQKKEDYVKKKTEHASKLRVFCAEWLQPLMNAGHWIPEMVEYAGGIERLSTRGQPSCYIDWKTVIDYDPEVLILMPCGFTTARTIAEARVLSKVEKLGQLTAVLNGNVFATDGHNYFSRSGPRLFDALKILGMIIHPELFNARIQIEQAARLDVAQLLEPVRGL
ncbi:MAG TPA: cobalamin-binding protein [Candidatus Bathyarchaeia archaeon]|nr:cobalamin-binding protein [Candidatus Bathyarchaeia archaeon]